MKSAIIEALTILQKKEIADGQPFKARAYAKAVRGIRGVNGDVTAIEDVDGVEGIGEKIRAKIAEILETGALKQVQGYAMRDDVKYIEDLSRVHGIGAAKAKVLVEKHGVKGVADLREKLLCHPDLVNQRQKAALKYVEDFEKRIPKDEMDMHHAYIADVIRSIDARCIVEIAGSYRRCENTSGDIDVLITHMDDDTSHDTILKSIVNAFKQRKYVVDVFAHGEKKCLAACLINTDSVCRRIDFMMTPRDQFAFALLYFTGSGEFNVELRNHALSKGYSLSEHGLKRVSCDCSDHPPPLYTEESIFAFLGLQYVHPSQRKAGALK